MDTWRVYYIVLKYPRCQNMSLHSISLFYFCSIHMTNNTYFLTVTQNHILLIMVSKLARKEKKTHTFPVVLFEWNIPSKQVGASRHTSVHI